MLMSIPFGMMRKDNPLTGLDNYDIIRYTFKPKSLSEVPTAQEVKAGVEPHTDETEAETETDDEASEPKESEDNEARLRRLLSSILRAVMMYFSVLD